MSPGEAPDVALVEAHEDGRGHQDPAVLLQVEPSGESITPLYVHFMTRAGQDAADVLSDPLGLPVGAAIDDQDPRHVLLLHHVTSKL